MVKSVIAQHVTKVYRMYQSTSQRLLDLLLPLRTGEEFYALRDVSFEADKGDVIGIVGLNGSGKSTLCNIIAGVIQPTAGEIHVDGQTSLVAIQAGLSTELTGRENIEQKCLMLGFSKKEIRELESEIVEFADIGPFIDQPVKNYSSGMRSRLGFAISVCVDPDVLVVDEALSVGDAVFSAKCMDKMNDFKRRGKTIFFISHSMAQVKSFCEKALWLDRGVVRAYGDVASVVPEYERFVKQNRASAP
ncbi:MAG: teichoic acids export ABC transporter ATP-binding subunit TagH [Thermoflavifilum sp.]|nr:teichoic acids export ABC transporter ATP-binding subunit TagH [Thermoflavifilum sp.]MCL6514453.1 teichoic acids export ABC transporter ATP-binding subunit TagH [Alicyclobacillus sp.]